MRAVLPLLMLVSAGAYADETFRCGRWVVSSDLTVTELRQRCGEPARIERSREDVYVKNQNHPGTHRSGVVETEVWTYSRGTQAAPMVVTIVDGKIKHILRAK
jgi:hypothetical protein